MDVQVVVAIAVPVIAAGVWLLRLEGRVNVHDDKFMYVGKLADERDKAIRDDLAYIRNRIDSAISHGRHE